MLIWLQSFPVRLSIQPRNLWYTLSEIIFKNSRLNPKTEVWISLLNRLIQDQTDHGASKKPKNPLWARIHHFLCELTKFNQFWFNVQLWILSLFFIKFITFIVPVLNSLAPGEFCKPCYKQANRSRNQNRLICTRTQCFQPRVANFASKTSCPLKSQFSLH